MVKKFIGLLFLVCHITTSSTLHAGTTETLMYFISENRIPAALELIQSRKVNVNTLSEAEWAPLHHAAAKRSCLEIVKALVAGGADVNLIDTNGWTALHYAANNNNAPAINYLLSQHANPNITAQDGMTPLQLAIRGEYSACIEALIQSGAISPNEISSSSQKIETE
ncbi:ankyrin repeat domain-containing protein [bacterium]|nr:MAG: ankyrin repeat domain-containing protein [bacterium]